MQNSIKFFPIKILGFFLIFTEIMFFIGPIDYKINNTQMLILYLLIVNISLILGYYAGVKRFKPSKFYMSLSIVKFIILFGLFLHIRSLIGSWQFHGINVSIDNFLYAIKNPGQVYYSESVDKIESSIFWMLLSPITWASIPLGIYSWKRLSFTYKCFVVTSFILSLATWIGIGTRKGIVDNFLILFFTLFALKPQLLSEKKYRSRVFIVGMLLICIFLVFFVYSNLSRSGSERITDIMFLSVSAKDGIKYSYLFLPTWLILTLTSITSYLCQGYYALALSLEMGVRQVVPMGMSWFTIALAKKFDYDPTLYTYMSDLEKYGIDMSINWHSIYVWLANDFTFIGVPVVVFFIGYFFAQTWCDSLVKKNPISYPIMTLFAIMIFYFFANNQILSFSFIPFVFWFFLYYFTRKFI